MGRITSCRTNSNPFWSSKWAMFSRRPVKKLSRQITSFRSANNLSHKCEPMKPAPPVISIRTFSSVSFPDSVEFHLGDLLQLIMQMSIPVKVPLKSFKSYELRNIVFMADRTMRSSCGNHLESFLHCSRHNEL